ncbi:MAG: bacteriorhodopsin [Leptolyngbya sp. Prado105]|nr:bacteriorhodopsin [Leptolyngbya sp. Prado105]
MDWQGLWHWLYIIGMSIGSIYFALLGRNPRGLPKLEYFVATFIPLWSGLMYLTMVLPMSGDRLQLSKFEIAGQISHLGRYADWIVTTPLLLLALSWTAMHHHKSKDWTLTFSLMATQVVVVVSGLLADLSDVPWVRYLWYTIGCVAFLVVLWGIWQPLREKTKGDAELSSFYNGLTTFFTITWICYPIIWILGPSGIRAFDQNVDTFLFCLVPFFSKVVFSFLDLNGLRSLRHHEAERPEDRFVSNTMRIMNRIALPWQSRRSRRRNRPFSEGT